MHVVVLWIWTWLWPFHKCRQFEITEVLCWTNIFKISMSLVLLRTSEGVAFVYIIFKTIQIRNIYIWRIAWYWETTHAWDILIVVSIRKGLNRKNISISIELQSFRLLGNSRTIPYSTCSTLSYGIFDTIVAHACLLSDVVCIWGMIHIWSVMIVSTQK